MKYEIKESPPKTPKSQDLQAELLQISVRDGFDNNIDVSSITRVTRIFIVWEPNKSKPIARPILVDQLTIYIYRGFTTERRSRRDRLGVTDMML